MTRHIRYRRAAAAVVLAFACVIGGCLGPTLGLDPADGKTPATLAFQPSGPSPATAATASDDVFEDDRPDSEAHQNPHGRLRCAAADHRSGKEPLSVAAPHLDRPHARDAVRPRGFDCRPRHTADRTAADTVTHLQTFLL